jgi:hypothetical protein
MAYQRSPAEQAVFDRIRPLRTARWQADYPWHRLEAAILEIGEDFGTLELIPDFQRGHVWTPAQQSHFIENCLRGVVAADGFLLQFNCPNFEFSGEGDLPDGLQCLDGLQRYTAITRFVRGEITAFGYAAEELMKTEFSPKRIHAKVAMHTFRWKADLLDHYLALNAGGTPHSKEEIERVEAMLKGLARPQQGAVIT